MAVKEWQLWLEQVTAQLRCRAAEKPVRAELEAHMQDQCDAFLAEGDSREQAVRKTLSSMGDPVEVGARLDSVHRPRSAWGPFLLAASLFVLGALVRCWGLADLGRQSDMAVMFLRSLVPVCVLALVYFTTDAAARLRHTPFWYIGALALVVGTVLITSPVNGTYVYARPLCAFLAFGHAAVLYRMRNRGLAGLVISGLSLAPLVLAALWIPAFAQAASLTLAGLALCLYCAWSDWFGWGRGKSLGLTAAVAVGAPVLFCLANQDLVRRGLERMNPLSDPEGSGFLSLQRWTVWQGRQPDLDAESVYRLLSADDTLTFGAYVLGRPAALVMLALLVLCLVLLWRTALRTRSAAGRLLGLAGAAVLTGQLLASAGPFSSVVPFLSDGVWSGCVQAVLAGVLLSAFRLDPVKGGRDPVPAEKRLHIRWE